MLSMETYQCEIIGERIYVIVAWGRRQTQRRPSTVHSIPLSSEGKRSLIIPVRRKGIYNDQNGRPFDDHGRV